MKRKKTATRKAGAIALLKSSKADAATRSAEKAESHEKGAAMDDWSHIKKLEKDAAYQATQDKGTSGKAQAAKSAAKDDYSHVKKLVKDAAYQAKQRRARQLADPTD